MKIFDDYKPGDTRNPVGQGPQSREMLPCGNMGFPDGTGYRCERCFAIYGSMACPKACKELGKKE